MILQTLITATDLKKNLENPNWVVLDVRYSLVDSEQGRHEYLQTHIPGAVFLHLEKDLSAEVIPGTTGRHPLPTVEEATRVFSSCGIGPGIQVIAYDNAGGALAAVRAWWILRWLGHDAVAILDGGWQSWLKGDYPVRSGFESPPFRVFIPQMRPEMMVSTKDVEQLRRDPDFRLIDARVEERYKGINENIDPIAGHIPGAINSPYLNNLTSDGFFRSENELRDYYKKLLGDVPAYKTIFYCGSGVTAILNILALDHIGQKGSRLYAGSWSEWIADKTHPVALD